MSGPRRTDDERETERPGPEPAVPAPAPAPASSVANILAMQQSVGNHAVTRHLARAKTAEETAAEEKNLDDAFKATDWDAYVAILTKMDRGKVKDKLILANEDQLRLIDDAAKRAGLPASGRVRENCRYHLGKWYGVKGKRQKTGYGFGDLKVRFGSARNGDPVAGTNYAFPVDITYTPVEDMVDAEEIAFIQRVRLVETSTGDNKDWDETNKKRATARSSSIDRIPGRKWGWYGMDDDSSNGGNLKKWVKGSEKTAWMHDTPSAQIPNTTWEFETAVVCRKGPDEGKVYAVTTWGFTIDDKLKLKPMEVLFFNKPTMDLGDAVKKWNEQADKPEADRNTPDQEKLPELT